MQPQRDINHDPCSPEENSHMFLRQLSSSFLPVGRPALCRAYLRSSSAPHSPSYLPCLPPTPYPWFFLQGAPPWPPLPPLSVPSAHQLHSGWTSHTQSATCWRGFGSSAGLRMERSGDRGPPQKRRRSVEDQGRPRGGSRREPHQLDLSPDSRPGQNRCSPEGGPERRSRGVKLETSHQGRSPHVHRTDKDPQAEARTPKPGQGQVPSHGPKPWSKERRAEEQETGRTVSHQAQTDRGPGPPGGQEDVGALRREFPLLTLRHLRPALQRHWEPSPACTSYPPPPGGGAFDFTVMSYNILSQELLQDNAYLYRHCPPDVLPWDRRLPNLLAEIERLDADILCLQEVQEDHYEDQIRPALQALGYQCEYKKRTGRKPDGCAVIFKTSRLSLLSSNPVEYFRRGDALLDRDNVGLVLLLQPNDSAGLGDPSAFICVANTHLLYNPRRGDIKLAQLAILLAEINRLTRLPDGSTNPVLLCGDLNSTPWSPLYSFLTTGVLEYRGMQMGMVSGQESVPRGQRLLPSPIWSQSLGIDHQCQYSSASEPPRSPTAVEGAISSLTVEDLTASAAAVHRARIEHGLKLRSSYQHLLMPDGRPEVTTCHSRTAMTVDYILYTPELVTPPSLSGGCGLQLLGRLSLVGQPELREVNGLPNRHHSSDHLPLLARFRLRR